MEQQKLSTFFPEIIPQKTFEPLKTTREERGKAIAESFGIEIAGTNKWLTIIQNASHHPAVNSKSDHSST